MSKRKTPHRPVPSKYQATLPQTGKTGNPAVRPDVDAPLADPFKDLALLVLFWSYVLIPLAWGVAATVRKALLLFRG